MQIIQYLNMNNWTGSSLFQTMACCLFVFVLFCFFKANSFLDPRMIYYQLDPWKKTICVKYNDFYN